jgi:hypothetical protein
VHKTSTSAARSTLGRRCCKIDSDVGPLANAGGAKASPAGLREAEPH